MAKPPLDFTTPFGLPQAPGGDPFAAASAHLAMALARQTTHGPPRGWLETASADEIESRTQDLRAQNHKALADILAARNPRFG